MRQLEMYLKSRHFDERQFTILKSKFRKFLKSGLVSLKHLNFKLHVEMFKKHLSHITTQENILKFNLTEILIHKFKF